jgi:hypothetical protein
MMIAEEVLGQEPPIPALEERTRRTAGRGLRGAAGPAEPVQALVDPQGRARQFVAARLTRLMGTRAGGFGLIRQGAAEKWGAAIYTLCRDGIDAGGSEGALRSAGDDLRVNPTPALSVWSSEQR